MGNQVRKRQIADGAIDDSKVQAGAAIVSTKLADGANFIKRDGSIAMQAPLDLGNQKIINVQTPSAATDATNKSYVDTAIANLNSLFDSKPSAKAATTGNVNIANPATNTFDTASLSVSDILFVRANTNSAENGLYLFNGAALPLTRIAAMDSWNEIPGSFFAVEQGSIYADTIWLCTADQGGTLGTTPITFQQIPTSAGLLNANFVDKEVPSGAINGVNNTFTLGNTPVAGSEHVYINGLLQATGAGNDYTITGSVITVNASNTLLAGESIVVSYRK